MEWHMTLETTYLWWARQDHDYLKDPPLISLIDNEEN